MQTSNNKAIVIAPLLISILLLVSSKLKPLEPKFENLTNILISLHQPISNLKYKVNQKKLFITSLPSIQHQNLTLKAENSQLKTQNLLLKNQLNLSNLETPSWNTVPVKIIKVDHLITATTNQIDQIKKGMPLVQSTNLIGIVKEILGPIIHILPLNHQDITFPLQVSPDIKGDFVFQNQITQMVNISNQTVPDQDETVFTLPTEQIPEGLVVGQVLQTLTPSSNPIQRVEIELSLNPSQLISAQIITKP